MYNTRRTVVAKIRVMALRLQRKDTRLLLSTTRNYLWAATSFGVLEQWRPGRIAGAL